MSDVAPSVLFSPNMTIHPYAFLALFLAVALAFPLVLLGLARVWARVAQPPGAGVSTQEKVRGDRRTNPERIEGFGSVPTSGRG